MPGKIINKPNTSDIILSLHGLPCSHILNKGIYICDINEKICLLECALTCDTLQDENNEKQLEKGGQQ